MTDESLPISERQLRPKERVIKRLADDGMNDNEIAWRFRSSPGHIERTRGLIDLSRSTPGADPASAPGVSLPAPGGNRDNTPLERTVLRRRAEGASHVEIAARLRRTPDFVARVEALAHYRTENRGRS